MLPLIEKIEKIIDSNHMFFIDVNSLVKPILIPIEKIRIIMMMDNIIFVEKILFFFLEKYPKNIPMKSEIKKGNILEFKKE